MFYDTISIHIYIYTYYQLFNRYSFLIPKLHAGTRQLSVFVKIQQAALHGQ